MYWADSDTDKVQSSTLDGSDVRDVVTDGGGPRCICLDVERGLMYWTGVGANSIYRASLDGSGHRTLVERYNHPCGLALVLE